MLFRSLIFQYDDDLYMIDQHAAHERLLYDEFCEKAKSGVIAKQTLLLPYVFKVSREDFDSIYQRYQYFRQLGIEIDNVGDDTFKISAVPSELCNINLKEFFDDILYDDSFKQETIPLTLKEKLMQKACKHAINTLSQGIVRFACYRKHFIARYQNAEKRDGYRVSTR